MIFSSLKVNLRKLNRIFHRHRKNIIGKYSLKFYISSSTQFKVDLTSRSFKVLLNSESFLKLATAPIGNIDVPTLALLHEMHGGEIDMDALEVEANVFRAITSNCRVGCFKDVYNKIKTCPEIERELIPNIAHNKAAFDQHSNLLFCRKIFFYSKKT